MVPETGSEYGEPDDITAEQPIWKSTIRGLEEFCVRNIKPSSGKIRLFIGAMDNCGVATEDIFNFPEKQFKNPYYQDTNCIDYAEKIRILQQESAETAGEARQETADIPRTADLRGSRLKHIRQGSITQK